MPRISLDSRENHSSNAEVASISWAVLILILGSVGFSSFEIWNENRQLTEVQAAIVQLQPQVEDARGNEVKLHALAQGILALAPHDSVAARLVHDFKIHDVSAGASVSASSNATGVPAAATR